MRSIANFFTLFWCIYFPTCIAFNELPGFSSIDEVMTGLLIIYTFMKKGQRSLNKGPWKEFYLFIYILFFYTAYGLIFGRNVAGGVWLDFIQELRPFTIIYCTWILNPRFSKTQKKWMLGTMIVTLYSWLLFSPERQGQKLIESEFVVLGQLAICTGMTWYLFTDDNKRNKYIALVLVFTGLLAPKFKFLGEVVCFVYLLFFFKKKLNFNSTRTVWTVVLLMSAVLFVTWERFDAYYVEGWGRETDRMARPETYKVALQLLWDYFPLGSGMGSFACNGAWKYYSPIYHEYNLDTVWGLDKGGGFIADAYYPTLAQFGIVGVILFFIFWKRRLVAMNQIVDMRYYKVAFMTFFCLAIEQAADSSWLSGKGMGYCMLIGLCLNANRNMQRQLANSPHTSMDIKMEKGELQKEGDINNENQR